MNRDAGIAGGGSGEGDKEGGVAAGEQRAALQPAKDGIFGIVRSRLVSRRWNRSVDRELESPEAEVEKETRKVEWLQSNNAQLCS